MKKSLRNLLLTAFIALGFTVNAQENSMLWEITGKDIEKPSYLFGTIHMMCAKDFVIREKVKNAFDKTGKLALEIDFDDPLEIGDLQKGMQASKPLSQLFSKEEYAELDAFLKEKIGAGASQFENMSLTAITSALLFKSLGCPPKMYEIEFLQMAMKRQSEILGLEKVKDQLESFDKSFSPKEFIEQLRFYDVSGLDTLIQKHKQEDLQAIYTLTTDPKMMDESARKWMLDTRNSNWVIKMPDMMKRESIFFAVGAAHLGGENGVISLLRKKGYTVKPIFD